MVWISVVPNSDPNAEATLIEVPEIVDLPRNCTWSEGEALVRDYIPDDCHVVKVSSTPGPAVGQEQE